MPRAVRLGVIVLALAAGAALAAPAGQAARAAGVSGLSGSSGPALDLYRVAAPPATVRRLVDAGFDVAATRPDGTSEIVGSAADAARLAAAGLHPTRWRDARGRSVEDLARADVASGMTVWKHWDGAGGLHEEIDALAAAHPGLVRTEVFGRSVEGRELVAVRVTGGGAGVPDGARPAVLYVSLQHAREWISGEVTRRLLHSVVDGYGADPEMTSLLDHTELWFVLVANPDGYERTFQPGNRLWRKNTADNDKDGKIDVNDGVDVNRNFPDHWGYTPGGSSDLPADQAYRGPAPASEPETRALMALCERLRFRFLVNYHSFGRLLLYPIGWQEQTPTADQPIYAALAGTPVNPAIPGYKPELSAALYPTNGETTSWAHAATGSLAFTVELGEGVPGSGFLFPDNEALVEQEYQLNRPFALDVARSAPDPTRPVSHLGNRVPMFEVDPFRVSYGDPQPVQATVLRRLGPAELHWQVGTGAEQQAPAVEWAGGRRYGDTGDIYEHRVRGAVTGTHPGDTVKVWFSAGGQSSDAFTYRVERHGGARVLVVVGGEHGWTAVPPAARAAPGERLAPIRTALAASGVDADVYDVEAHGRIAPNPLGVLGHYDTVVWTSDEASRAGRTPALRENVSRLANAEMLAARDYLNEGGRLIYMGRDAGRFYAEGARYNPVTDGPCTPPPPALAAEAEGDEISDGCVALSDEFFRYWLGAYEISPDGGRASDSAIAPVDGVRAPFDGATWNFSDARVAPGANAAAYSATRDVLGDRYPELPGVTAARYRIMRPGRGEPDPSGAARTGTGTAAAVETPSSLLFGFGFEDIATPAERAEVMRRALSFLLPRR